MIAETKVRLKSKRCSRCGEMKPVDEFCLQRSSRDGLHYYCRPCNSLVANRYTLRKRATAKAKWAAIAAEAAASV